MALNDRLKRARSLKGLTLDEVAQKVGVSRQTIQRYESGVISNIPSDNIEKLASAYGTTPAELMGWDLPPLKVTTRIQFDDNSEVHDLFQNFIRRPEPVQKEIIRLLKDMDVTFSKNVSKLLQESGGVDAFMKYTGIQFAVVGQLMQGEPTEVSPVEAEKVAEFFKVDVVDLFFHTNTGTVEKESPKNTKPVSFKKELGLNAKNLLPFIKDLENKNIYMDDEAIERVYAVIHDERFEKILKKVIDSIDDGNMEQADFDDIYALIAKKVFLHPENFRREYLDSEISEHHLRQLLSSRHII